MKRACVFDWDGTLRPGITALDWIEFLQPTLPNAEAAAKAMHALIANYRSGKASYGHLVSEAAELYAHCVSQANVTVVTDAAMQFVERDCRYLFEFTEPVLRTAKQRGYEIFLVSGTPAEVLEAYSSVLAIDHVLGMTVQRLQGRFTGLVAENFGLAEKKREATNHIRDQGFLIELAAGNSTNDLPLLEHARHQFLISNEKDVAQVVKATIIDTEHALKRMLEAL